MPEFRTSSVWQTPGLIPRLTHLWTQDRHSASRIAETLNREFGLSLTRNAVIAKTDRLKLLGKGGGRKADPPKARRVLALSSPLPNTTITLPSVGGSYAYVSGCLLRDGTEVARKVAW